MNTSGGNSVGCSDRILKSSHFAFTLVELLIVIAIIGILASLTAAAVIRVSVFGKKTKARAQMSGLITATESYGQDYGHFPISQPLQDTLHAANWAGDYTYGGSLILAQPSVPNHALFATNNSEVLAILMNLPAYPGSSVPTADTGHLKNAKERIYLQADFSGDTTSPGVGNDLVYRDPWGNPYIISFDLNNNDQCQDAFYGLNNVSGNNQTGANPGLYGLVNPDPAKNDDFQSHGNIMVWSAGPDGKIDPAKSADSDVNKDNILSWK